MGRASRSLYAPPRLAEKLLQIRQKLGLTQEELLRQLKDFPTLQQSVISGYERGDREPALLVLFAYARLANVYVDVLLDDAVNLPDKLPSRQKSEGIVSKAPFPSATTALDD